MPRVSLKDTEQSFEVKDGEVIYDALSNHGLELPHGCLAGSCGACRIEVISGSENLQVPGVIEQNTIEAVVDELVIFHGVGFMENKVVRLSCRAKVKGDVVIRPLR